MKLRDPRRHVWIIWGLVGSFGLVEAVAWTVGGGIPRRPIVLVQVITAWVVMLILASLATRRMRFQAQRIRAHEHTHQETLGAYSEARQADPTLVSVTVPLDRGLEVTVLL